MTEAVEIALPDWVVLRGELRRAGPEWAVLLHDLGEDLDAWGLLPARIAAQGLSVLAVDLRGHGGSDGEPDALRSADDLEALLAWARAAGAERIVLGAAGASAQAAAGSNVDGVFLLAPLGDAFAPSPAVPKLVVAGPEGGQVADELRRCGGWTVVVRLPANGAGLSVLRGRWATNVESYVLAFLRDVRRSAPVGG